VTPQACSAEEAQLPSAESEHPGAAIIRSLLKIFKTPFRTNSYFSMNFIFSSILKNV